jgi:hypothetical protein
MSGEVHELPALPYDDQPHELQTDHASEPDAQESVRRHNARQAAHNSMYRYKLDGTPEENAELRRLRDQTEKFGPEAIREAEAAVREEFDRTKHLRDATENHHDLRIEDFVDQDERKTNE